VSSSNVEKMDRRVSEIRFRVAVPSRRRWIRVRAVRARGDGERRDACSTPASDRRHERAAGDDVTVRGQERGRRPAAEVVALVDVGTAIGVDADGDEAVADERRDLGIRVRRPIHLVAGRHHAAVIDSSTGLPSRAARAKASALHGSQSTH
jgi:hypothetical protein